jgi:hypothetical protein
VIATSFLFALGRSRDYAMHRTCEVAVPALGAEGIAIPSTLVELMITCCVPTGRAASELLFIFLSFSQALCTRAVIAFLESVPRSKYGRNAALPE